MGLKRQITDIVLAPTLRLAAKPMRYVRRFEAPDMPRSHQALRRAGIFPLTRHYYEPLFDMSGLKDLDKPRDLPGIDFNVAGQLALLASFQDVEAAAQGDDGFDPGNNSFKSGDAELWFHVVKHCRPRRIIEIGSGHSTRMAIRATRQLKAADPAYACEHTCIEPYEAPWLEQTGVKIIRQPLQAVDLSLFDGLASGDILFIDSSHIIRPQGDVLIEYLQVLPRLASGVVVHIHDIFTPRDYIRQFFDVPRFWNEQYLLEAFLSDNANWEVLLAANMMMHDHYDLMRSKCIWLTPDREPGSFYMRRR